MNNVVDLIDDLIIDGVHLALNRGTGEILDTRGIDIIAVSLDDHDFLGLIVRGGEVYFLLTLRGIGHARDDSIDFIVLKRKDQIVPVQLHNLNIHIIGFRYLFSDDDIVAVAIVNIRDRLCGSARLCCRPVERSVVALHAYAECLPGRVSR